MAALAWLIARVRFYEIGAENLQASLSLHPIRHSYLISRLKRESSLTDHLKQRTLSLVSAATARTVADQVSLEPGFVEVPLPFFSAWLASQREDIPSMLELALDIKTDPDFRRFRQSLADVTNDIVGLNAAKSLREDVHRNVDAFFGKYSTPETSPTSTALLDMGQSFSNTNVGLIKQVYSSIAEAVSDVESGVTLFRRISHDLANIPKWGHLRDILGGGVKIVDKPTAELKTLAPDERYRHLDFRKPM